MQGSSSESSNLLQTGILVRFTWNVQTTIMNKVTISTRVEAPKIPSLDLRSYPTDDDSRIDETTSLNKLRRDMVDRNRKKG